MVKIRCVYMRVYVKYSRICSRIFEDQRIFWCKASRVLHFFIWGSFDMRTNDTDRLINSIMAGATIVIFIGWLIISKNNFSQSFFENLFMVAIYLIGSFFIGNIVIGIPIAVFHYLTNHTFEKFYEISSKNRFLIITLIAVICCVLTALIIT